MGCLSETLTKLPIEKLTKQQISVITTFLCDRLDDDDCLKEVATGLYAIVQMNGFNSTNIEELLESLNSKVVMKKHVQNTRHYIFLILDTVLKRFFKCMCDVKYF